MQHKIRQSSCPCGIPTGEQQRFDLADLPVGISGRYFRVVPDGFEPSFPGCEPSVVAVGPRDPQLRPLPVSPVEGQCRSLLQLDRLSQPCLALPFGRRPGLACSRMASVSLSPQPP